MVPELIYNEIYPICLPLSVTMFASFHLSVYAGPYMGAITVTTAYRGRGGGGGGGTH